MRLCVRSYRNYRIINISQQSYLAEGSDKSRGKIDLADKPWWLRETTYTSNDLFRTGSKVKDEGHATSAKLKQQLQNEVVEDPFSVACIQETFRSVQTTLTSLKSESKRKMEFMIPLLPAQCTISNDSQSVPLFSIVRFDEDPAANEDLERSTLSQSNKRLKRIDSSIITNFRLSKDENRIGKQSVFESTLVAPYQDSIEGGNCDELTQEGDNGDKNEVLYDWVKDYSMDVQNHNMGDSFLFFQSENSRGESEMSYIPYAARVEMKKLNVEDSMPHECFVTRKFE